jgi:hypothetical protein
LGGRGRRRGRRSYARRRSLFDRIVPVRTPDGNIFRINQFYFQLHVSLRFARVKWHRKIHTGKKEREHKMKTNMKTMMTVLALGASAFIVSAQDNYDSPPGGRGPGGPGGPAGPGGPGRQPPPAPPIVAALDANHDGVIDAQEIANASAALKSLDRNGDGKLAPDEFMGPRPPRPGGPGRGPGGNPGADGYHFPPGPPPGGAGGPPPDGAPPGQQ